MAGSILTGFFLARSVLEAADRGFAGTGRGRFRVLGIGRRSAQSRPDSGRIGRHGSGSLRCQRAGSGLDLGIGAGPRARHRAAHQGRQREFLRIDLLRVFRDHPLPLDVLVSSHSRLGSRRVWRSPRVFADRPSLCPARSARAARHHPDSDRFRMPRRTRRTPGSRPWPRNPIRTKDGGCSPTSPGSGRPDCSSRGRSAASCRPPVGTERAGEQLALGRVLGIDQTQRRVQVILGGRLGSATSVCSPARAGTARCSRNYGTWRR